MPHLSHWCTVSSVGLYILKCKFFLFIFIRKHCNCITAFCYFHSTDWELINEVADLIGRADLGKRGSKCVYTCDSGRKKRECFFSGKRKQHMCVWPTVPVEMFTVCLLYPSTPWVFARGYGSLSGRWQNSLLEGEVCILSEGQSTRRHNAVTILLGEWSALASVGCWGAFLK